MQAVGIVSGTRLSSIFQCRSTTQQVLKDYRVQHYLLRPQTLPQKIICGICWFLLISGTAVGCYFLVPLFLRKVIVPLQLIIQVRDLHCTSAYTILLEIPKEIASYQHFKSLDLISTADAAHKCNEGCIERLDSQHRKMAIQCHAKASASSYAILIMISVVMFIH